MTSTAFVAEPSVCTCIHVTCGYTLSLCNSVISFLVVSTWSLVTVSIVIQKNKNFSSSFTQFHMFCNL